MGSKRRANDLVQLLRDALGLPVTFSDRVANRRKSRLSGEAVAQARETEIARVLECSREEVAGFVDEARALALSAERDRLENELVGIDSPMSTDDSFSLYAVARAAEVRLAVETGTAAGASALYLSHAMQRNGGGRLHSVDVVDDDLQIGVMVSRDLRPHVDFHRGNSLEVLPGIFRTQAPIDLFVHDSLHEYSHMMAEYELALGAVRSGGVIASHDVMHSNAWRHFLRRHRLERAAEIRNFGFCVVP